MNRNSRDLRLIEKQLFNARKELNEEMSLQSVQSKETLPFSILKCERMNRVIDALEAQRDKYMMYDVKERHYQEGTMYMNRKQNKPKPKPFLDDTMVKSWTWKGRKIKYNYKPDDSNDKKVKEMIKKSELLKNRIAEMESKIDIINELLSEQAVNSNKSKIESTWSEETKEKVENAVKIADERIKEKEKLKKELYEKADKLKREYLNEAATNVQSVFRGHLGRKKMRQARKEYDLKIQHEGAEIIQSRFRGHLVRQQMKQKKKDKLALQEQASAAKIQSLIRGKQARSQLKNAKTKKERQQAAALMIQSWWRGILALAQFWEAKDRFWAEAEAIAAVMLQSAWRCYKARKQVNRLKKEQFKQMQEAAAIMLQAAWRGYLARKQMKHLKVELATVKDQLEDMEQADRELEEKALLLLMNAEQRAAVRIQALFRGFKARKELRRKQRQLAMNERAILREAQRQKEMEDEIERKLEEERLKRLRENELRRAQLEEDERLRRELEQAQAEAEAQMPEEPLEGNVVYAGDILLPYQIPKATRRLSTKSIPVNVSVREVYSPYRLRFYLQIIDSDIAFEKQIDVETLETLLKPMFEDELTQSLHSKPVEKAMHKWVISGKPPQRKYLIAWLLDRMWLEQQDDDLELCLGSASAVVGNTLHGTLTPALVDVMSNRAGGDLKGTSLKQRVAEKKRRNADKENRRDAEADKDKSRRKKLQKEKKRLNTSTRRSFKVQYVDQTQISGDDSE